MVGRRLKLTASLILRNELDRYLGPCLDALLEYVDEIRVLDDSSSDGWEETLRPSWGSSGARVLVHRHTVADRNAHDSFHLHAAARTALMRFTLEGDADYVLAIDADEFVTDGPAVRRACGRGPEAVSTVITEVWEACDELLCTREDGGWRQHPIANVWSTARFRGEVLKLTDRGTATGRVPDVVHRAKAIPSGAATLHFGWANRADRPKRFMRYGGTNEGHASAHVKSIMWPDELVTLKPESWPVLPAGVREQVVERAQRGDAA